MKISGFQALLRRPLIVVFFVFAAMLAPSCLAQNQWSFFGATFTPDGATAAGTFTFDAATNTYTSVKITVTDSVNSSLSATNSSASEAVSLPSGATATAIAAGFYHTCALLWDGTVNTPLQWPFDPQPGATECSI